ncbi:MAG: hypothetical protein AAF791_15320 [Bacteroidota bacterium]
MTRFLSFPLALLLALVLPLSACGGGDDTSSDEVEETGAPSTAFGQAMQGVEALQEIAEQAEEIQNTQPAEPLNHRVLLETLPEEAAGMPRTETTGESTNMGGAFAISTREATYADSTGDSRITIEVTDLGALPSAAMFGVGWAMVDMDKETSSGYERTITYQGHRGYREYDNDRRRGELSALIEGRYLVKVTGSDIEDDQLEASLQAVDTRRLASMKDEGRPTS